MSEPRPETRTAFSPLEYAAPVLVVLLVALGVWWYYGYLKQRVKDRIPPPEQPRIELRLPREGGG